MASSEHISIDDSVVAAANQVSSELAGEAVILDLDAGLYYGLDEVGARIWGMIQQPRSLSSVRDALLEEFQVSPEQCEQDLLSLVRNLADVGLAGVAHAAAH